MHFYLNCFGNIIKQLPMYIHTIEPIETRIQNTCCTNWPDFLAWL
jgi:hypothetical protein